MPETEVQQQPEPTPDDLNGFPETEPLSLEDQLEEFGKKAAALTAEARELGLSAMFLACGYDPLAHETYRNAGYAGNFYAIKGALHTLLEQDW